MERFIQLFADFLVLVYHCFDRIVIHGYLSGLSRPEQVVYFFRQVLGIPVVDKEVLSRRTHHYQGWVEAYARNHNIPIECGTHASVGRQGSTQTGSRPTGASPHAARTQAWRRGTFSPSTLSSRACVYARKRGTGPDVPHQPAQVSDARPQLC